MEDLREGLNALAGPKMTEVDVEQRIREFREKRYGNGYPLKDVEAEALAVFAEEKRLAEARLRNGADCPWTAAIGIPDLHCCKNGRLYRLRALKTTGKYEPAFEVLRVDHVDVKRGRTVGRYRTRGEASKAVTNVAYQEDDL